MNKAIYLTLIVLLFSVSSFAQEATINQRPQINEQTAFVNELIEHLNSNLKKLRTYQEKLNAWAVEEDPEIDDAPFYHYMPFMLAGKYKAIKSKAEANPATGAFDYQAQLEKLYKQSLLFNQFCKELKNINNIESSVKYYEINMKVMGQIDQMSKEWVDISYDFSLACSVSFGKMELPTKLDLTRDVIAKSKNVIMAMRDNNPELVTSYLNQLDLALANTSKNQSFAELVKEGKFNMNKEDVELYCSTIEDQAFSIASWAEQYLQSNKTPEEVEPILAEVINEFNSSKSGIGCASVYNKMLSKTYTDYLNFTEEPLFFHVNDLEIQILEPEALQDEIIAVEDLPSSISTLTANADTGISTLENIEAIDIFKPEDVNSLAGALPSNLIVLLDVSASMKTSGKLPILKKSLEHLVSIMRPEDRISLIAYSGEAELLLSAATVAQRFKIFEVLNNLTSSGGTDIEKALEMAYGLAVKTKMEDGNNRIVVASDGIFGVSSSVLKLIKDNAINNEVSTSIFHFADSKNQKKLESLQRIAAIGKGSYAIISDDNEAINALVGEAKQPK